MSTLSEAKKVRGEVSTKLIKKGSEKEVLSVVSSDNSDTYFQEPSYVQFKLGATLNMGNYESLRIEYSITKPCLEENIGIATEDIKERVKEEVNKEVELHKKGYKV